jgi:cytidylate kinase
MIKTIILNGPPGSGKDTIANLIVEQCNATKHEFKFSLYKETADYYKVDLKEFIALAIHRIEKESLKNWFGIKFGITPRNALIHVSEDIIKPLHGLAYFGDRATEQ